MRAAGGVVGGAILLGALGAQAGTALDEPLALANRHPLVQVYGLPEARGGAVLAAGQSRWRAGYDVASHFVVEDRGAEALILDGETQRLELGAQFGLGRRWEAGFSLPLLRHGGGNLDSFIEGWHNVWGLPDGDRPDYPRNRIAYRYSRNGVELLDFQRARGGVGDLRLNAAYSLFEGADSALALVGNLKLPTGDAGRLTGSEGTDFSLALAATRERLWDTALSVNASIGALRLGRGDVLEMRQKDAVAFGSAGLSWAGGQNWRLKAQVDAHTAFYRSDLRALGGDSVQLLLGGSVQVTPRWVLDLALSEDIAVDTAPDVVFQLALRGLY